MFRCRTKKAVIENLEARTSNIISNLMSFGDDVSVDLADRLLRCQHERRARARAQALTGRPFQGWPIRCLSPACWSCRRSIVAKWQNRVRERFANAENDHCTLLTIAISRLGSLYPAQALAKKFRRDLRNVRDVQARKAAGWASVSMFGHLEFDALEATDVVRLGTSRQTLIPTLPVVGGAPDATLWVPHVHLVVEHPKVGRDELKRIFGEQWPGQNRVDAKPFDQDFDAPDNAAACVGYSLKFRSTTVFADATAIDWPVAWVAQFWSWLHSLRRGIQPLQINVGAKLPR